MKNLFNETKNTVLKLAHKTEEVGEKMGKVLNTEKSDKGHKYRDENVMLKKENLLSWDDPDATLIGSAWVKASKLQIDDSKQISPKKFTGRFYTIVSSGGKITGKLCMMMYLWRISKLERDGNMDKQRKDLRKKF